MDRKACLKALAESEQYLDTCAAPMYGDIAGQPGDQVAITISNALMDCILVHLQGVQWEYIKALRAESVMTVCREYPGAWVRSIIAELKKEG